MTPYYEDDMVTLWHGDCRQVMSELGEASVDAIVTDPPYELAFMGKGWDASGIAYDRRVWENAWHVLKPGGHLLAFGGTRTWHRLAAAIEDAGFEIRDSIAWLYGSGFPKSLDVSKAIDKAAGVQREVVGSALGARNGNGQNIDYGTFASAGDGHYDITAPATPAAQQWQGWGTALKPAFEPIVVARKPLIGTVAENVLAHGTGALNIDGCRVQYASESDLEATRSRNQHGHLGHLPANNVYGTYSKPLRDYDGSKGRWPANVILDESQAAELDRQSGVSAPKPEKVGRRGGTNANPMSWDASNGDLEGRWPADPGGGASRFFYVAKANSSERPRVNGVAHPTVKPLDLMRYLVRLVTPPGGTVLEPFAGSGTTLEACVMEGFHAIGIELTDEYLPLIRQRLSKPIEQVLL